MSLPTIQFKQQSLINLLDFYGRYHGQLKTFDTFVGIIHTAMEIQSMYDVSVLPYYFYAVIVRDNNRYTLHTMPTKLWEYISNGLYDAVVLNNQSLECLHPITFNVYIFPDKFDALEYMYFAETIEKESTWEPELITVEVYL